MTGSIHEYKCKLCSCCEGEKAAKELFQQIILRCCDDKTLDDPNVAFVSILKSSFNKEDRKALKSLSFKNCKKILTSKGEIRTSINIDEMDVVMVIDFLLHYKAFMTSYENGFGLKCKNDDGSSRHQKICCSTCGTCVKCNLSGAPCENLSLRSNLEEIRAGRNLYAHLTFDEYEEYERNGTFIDLLVKLHEAIASILKELLKYGCLDNDSVTDRMDNMYIIRKKNQETYFSLYAKQAAVFMINPDLKQFTNSSSNDDVTKIDVEMSCQLEKKPPWWRVFYDYMFSGQTRDTSFGDFTESADLKSIKASFTEAASQAINNTLQMEDSQHLFTVRITGFKKNVLHSQNNGIVHFKLQMKWMDGLPVSYRELDSDEAMDTRQEFCRALKQSILDVLQICVNVECIAWEIGSLLLEFIAFKKSILLSTHEQNLIKRLLLSNSTRKIIDDVFIGRFILQISFPEKSRASLLIQLRVTCFNETVKKIFPNILPLVRSNLTQAGNDNVRSLTVSSTDTQDYVDGLSLKRRLYKVCLLGTSSVVKNPIFTFLLNEADRLNIQVVSKNCLSIPGSTYKILLYDYGCIEEYIRRQCSKHLFTDMSCIIISYPTNAAFNILNKLSILSRYVHDKNTKVILLADITSVHHDISTDDSEIRLSDIDSKLFGRLAEETAVLLAQVGDDIQRTSASSYLPNIPDILHIQFKENIPDLSQIQFKETGLFLREIGDTIAQQYLYHRNWLMEILKRRVRSLYVLFPIKRKSRAVSGHPFLSQLNIFIPKTVSSKNGWGIGDFIKEDLPNILKI